MRWHAFERQAPELAALAGQQFQAHDLALIGTLRRDGSPRISCVEPRLLDGDLYLGMMWHSRKAVDLLRDPRLVLHNAIATNTGNEVEVAIHGVAIEVRDATLIGRFREGTAWRDRLHLFAVDIESAASIRYDAGLQHVEVWPRGVSFTRSYG